MLLLHISDIHFRKGEIGSTMDPNYHLRNELVRDAEEKCRTLGSPAAVLISGDIAFAGLRDEYDFALSWIKELCERCGTSLSNVFVCPGNHDVVRTVAARHVIQALHKAVKGADEILLDPTVRGLLQDEETGKFLYESIAPYNLFAVQFFCDLTAPQRTFADRPLVLNDGSTLHLWALNSTFVSSAADQRGDLVVDPTYSQIVRKAGVEHLVMCHHPYDWLRNGVALRDHLNDVSRIHLFGHLHTNRIDVGRDHVRIAASAAHPDRTEHGWEPGYNLIDVSVRGESGDRHLDISVHVRIWQSAPGQFRSKMDRGRETFDQSIELDGWNRPGHTTAGDLVPADAMHEQTADRANETGSDPMKSVRDLSVRFFKLSLSQRSAIAGKLDLLEDEDVNQPDFERFRRALLRAKERDILEALETEISALEKPSSTI
jgi:3',5'-cyclic AMP phosphodiesterase CpdA